MGRIKRDGSDERKTKIAERTTELRKFWGFEPPYMAAILGLKEPTLWNRYEKGAVEQLNPNCLVRAMEIFHINPQWLHNSNN